MTVTTLEDWTTPMAGYGPSRIQPLQMSSPTSSSIQLVHLGLSGVVPHLHCSPPTYRSYFVTRALLTPEDPCCHTSGANVLPDESHDPDALSHLPSVFIHSGMILILNCAFSAVRIPHHGFLSSVLLSGLRYSLFCSINDADQRVSGTAHISPSSCKRRNVGDDFPLP